MSPSLLRRWLTLLLLVLAGCPLSAHAEAILHAFNWRYDEIEARAADIAARGYGAVLVAPPLKSEGSAWWARYQPQDYRVIDHPLGNTESLRALADRLRPLGVKLYADIVINHMANEAAQRPDLDYPGQRVLSQYAANTAYFERQRLFGSLGENLLAARDFHPAGCIQDYFDLRQVQTLRLCGGGGDPGLPDLNDHDRVIAAQRAYLLALKQVGVTGFRIDAAKHMGEKHLARALEGVVDDGDLVFGELITGGGAGDREYALFLQPWLARTGWAAYDFPLHAMLRRGFAFGGDLSILADPLASGQALPDARAVTFAVTHDIPNNQGFRGLLLDPVDETLAYAYLFGRKGGSPLVYSDHNESGDGRWVDAYRRDDLTAMIGFHNAVAGEEQQQTVASSACLLAFRRGALGLVAINKCGNSVEFDVDAGGDKLWQLAPYRDVLSGDTLVLSARRQRVVLPARTARMWLRAAANAAAARDMAEPR